MRTYRQSDVRVLGVVFLFQNGGDGFGSVFSKPEHGHIAQDLAIHLVHM